MGVLLSEGSHHASCNCSERAGREALAIGICLLIAFLLRCFRVDISTGVFPDFVSELPFIGHKGFVCPLCGGTRAFALVSTFSFAEALHYSLLGVFVSTWLLLTFPIRLLCRFSGKPVFGKLYLRVLKFESVDHLMILMAVFLWLQLGLHYFLDFTWIPLEQLNRTM